MSHIIDLYQIDEGIDSVNQRYGFLTNILDVNEVQIMFNDFFYDASTIACKANATSMVNKFESLLPHLDVSFV
jgi:hypothetical protein